MQDDSGFSQPSGDYGYYGATSPLPPMPPRPPRRRIGLLSYLGVAIAAGALGAGTVVAVYHPAASSSSAAAQPSGGAIAPAPLGSGAVPQPGSGGSGGNASVQQILNKVSPGVVIINTALQYSGAHAAGTGMVINSDGLVLTNNHVIEGSTNVTATVLSSGKTYQAKVMGYDVTGDIALIQLQHASGLRTVPIGDSSKVKVGDSVVAMGNAEGQNRVVPAPGEVTALNQTITASDENGTISSETLHGMIGTNAQVISGDSGGPLASSSGQVIGMDTAGDNVRYPQQQSTVGFAIPINTALSVARQIAAGQGSSTIQIGYPPFMGIYIGKGTDASPKDQAQQEQNNNSDPFGGFGNGFGNGNGNGSGNGSSGCYNSDANLSVPASIASANSGTLVLGTICGGPAAAAGMTAGSVITGVNGQTIGSPKSLTSAVSKYHPGDTISVTWVTPSGQHQTGSLTLKAGPPL